MQAKPQTAPQVPEQAALQAAIETLDAAAIVRMAQDGDRCDHLKHWLHDACDLAARTAIKLKRPAQALPMFEALEQLAPGQTRRWTGEVNKMGDISNLTKNLIPLRDESLDAWIQRRKLPINRKGAFAQIDAWIADPTAADLDEALPWKLDKRHASILEGARVGIGVLRGDTGEQLAARVTRFQVLEPTIAMGVVRVARRIDEQRNGAPWDAERWPASNSGLAWLDGHCKRTFFAQSCSLIQMPQEIVRETIEPLLERMTRAPAEYAREQMEAATASPRGGRSVARL